MFFHCFFSRFFVIVIVSRFPATRTSTTPPVSEEAAFLYVQIKLRNSQYQSTYRKHKRADSNRHPASTSPAHPVSVPIRRASDKSSVVTSFETGICIHRKIQENTRCIQTRYPLIMRVASGLVFLEYGRGALGIFQVACSHLQSWPPFRFTLFFLPEQA